MEDMYRVTWLCCVAQWELFDPALASYIERENYAYNYILVEIIKCMHLKDVLLL